MHCSILKLFGISELNEVSASVDDDSVFVEGKLEGRSSCPRCRSFHLTRKSKNHRILHLPPVCGKIAKLQVLVQKQLCINCKYSWWPNLPFTRGKERITRPFINYALALLRFGTIKDVIPISKNKLSFN